MIETHLPPNWRGRLLAVLNSGRLLDREAHNLLLAWSLAEGGDARWNPLNSTLAFMGSKPHNTTAVQSYTTALHGVCATALTVANGRYTGICSSLQGGKLRAHEIVETFQREFETWGSNPDTILEHLIT